MKAPDLESKVRKTFDSILQNSSQLTRQVHGEGYRVPLIRTPKLLSPGEARAYAAPECEVLHAKWSSLVQNGQAKVTSNETPGFYSRSFLTKKKSGKEFRLISDMRKLNAFTAHAHHKMKGLRDLLPLMEKGSLMSVFDVRDGYFNVPIARTDQKYFRFIVGSTCYQLMRLPMGYVGSAKAFESWLEPYLETLRTLFPELRIFSYVDDCIVMSPPKRPDVTPVLRKAIKALQLPTKEDKCLWGPSTKVEYLGFIIDSRRLTIHCPPKKARAIRKQVRQTLRRTRQKKLRLRHLATTLGMLIALLPAAPQARLHAGFLYSAQARAINSGGWSANPHVCLSEEATAELSWWETFLSESRRYPLDVQFQAHEITIIASDASQDRVAAALISDPNVPVWHRALSRREARLHINVKEMIAALEGSARFPVAGTFLNFRVDNMTVVSAINKWSTRQNAMLPYLRALHDWALRTRTKVSATYIHTEANVVADKASRNQPISPDDKKEMAFLAQSIRASRRARWRIQKGARRALFRAHRIRPRIMLSGPCSSNDQLLPRGFLPVHAKGRRSVFAFPNLNQITETLNAMLKSKATATVLLPLWPSAPWFPRAAQMLAGMPVLLPPDAVRPWNQKKPSWPRWSWISARLSGSKRRRTAFRSRLACATVSQDRPCCVTLLGGQHWADLSPRTREHSTRFLRIATKAKF